MRTWLTLGTTLVLASAAHAFTIDFEQRSGFGQPGDPLPAVHSTPFGDIAFENGFLVENPLAPGTQMASQRPGNVDATTVFRFTLSSASVQELQVVFVNPNGEEIFVQYFETSSGFEEQDFGASVPAQGTRLVSLPDDDPPVSPGADFYGASFDFDNRCSGSFEWPGCTTRWGIDSVTIVPVPGTSVPIPEPSSALLALVGSLLVGRAVARSRDRGSR